MFVELMPLIERRAMPMTVTVGSIKDKNTSTNNDLATRVSHGTPKARVRIKVNLVDPCVRALLGKPYPRLFAGIPRSSCFLVSRQPRST
jgi:hypothetical protein